ncbi:MAG: ABC transporter substrate-binding protein [Rhodospirillales bacterium]|nr:ABC transporter substrate-binding protein [Rhodospirillales bacterium]
MGRRGLLAGSGATMAALCAPALAASESERVLRFMPQVDLVSLDPHYSMTNVTRNHAGLVFDQLYGTDSKQQAQPQMVEGHVMEDGGRRWTLTLREGLVFHDGEKVRARDCVASLRRWGRRDVLGVELLRISDEIVATDDRTIVFRFKQPFPRLPQALGKPGAYMPAMMPERLAETDPYKQIPEVIGSGPFRYVAAERLQGVRNVYAKFDRYVPRPTGTPDRAAGPKIVHFERVVWTTMPDQGVALAALQTGEQDWWEYAAQDLLPLIRRDPKLRGEVLETEGNMAFVRFNHLQPPFDRPEMRRVILRALDQTAFTAALGGGIPELQRPGTGFYPIGMPDATEAGLASLHPPLSEAAAKAALVAAGYKGEKIVQISPGDYPNVKAANEVLADLLKRIGINLDYISMDWASMTQRVINKGPPETAGFHIHALNVPSLSLASPLVNSRLRGTGSEESGWYTSARYEELRNEWLVASDAATQARLNAALQQECLATVPLVPAGITLQPAAWRADLEGVLGGVPKFWNVRRRT